MDRADARASQHGDGRLGNHRQIDKHPITFFNAIAFKHIAKETDLAMQLLIGKDALLAALARRGWFAFPH